MIEGVDHLGIAVRSIDEARGFYEALGLHVEEIEVVGADIQNENWNFRVGDNGASRIGDFIWFGPLKSIQNLFFRTPLVNLFIFGSEAYHDFYRWPAKDRRTFETWMRDTHWGRLFDRYRQGELPRGDTSPEPPAALTEAPS